MKEREKDQNIFINSVILFSFNPLLAKHRKSLDKQTASIGL